METKPVTSIWKLALYIPIVILLVALLVVSRHLGSYLFLDVVVIFVLPGFISLYILNLLVLKAVRFFGANGTENTRLLSVGVFLFFASWFLSTNVLCLETTCTLSSGFPLTVYEIKGDKYPFFEVSLDRRYLFDSMVSFYLTSVINYNEYQNLQVEDDTKRESPFRTINLLFNFLLHFTVIYLLYILVYKKRFHSQN